MDDIVDIMPRMSEQEHAVAVSTQAYECAKADASVAANKLSALQQQFDEELASKPKAKPDPELEEQLEELKISASACEENATAAKRQLRAAESALNREKQRVFIKLKSERSVLLSKMNGDSYAKSREEVNTSIDQGKEILKDEARRIRKEAHQVAKEKASEERLMHFATHVDTFALGFRGSWAQGQKFAPAPRAPPTVWMPPEPPPYGEPEALSALKKALGQNFFRVVDLFSRWDVDCDHTISKSELRMALAALKVPHDETTLSVLFDDLDEDRSGSIDFDELHKALRKHVPKRMPPNHITLAMPKRREPLPDGTGAERRAVAALKKALHMNYGKISTLFHQWDKDGDGNISKSEVRRALAAMCIAVDDKSLSTLFRKLDTDNSGARSKLPTASMMKIDHRRGQYLKHDRKRPRSTSGGSVPSAPTAPPTP